MGGVSVTIPGSRPHYRVPQLTKLFASTGTLVVLSSDKYVLRAKIRLFERSELRIFVNDFNRFVNA